MGAWIEIFFSILLESLNTVAPLVGAWIEIPEDDPNAVFPETVAPLVGAWIEIIATVNDIIEYLKSLLSWERGLKLFLQHPYHIIS